MGQNLRYVFWGFPSQVLVFLNKRRPYWIPEFWPLKAWSPVQKKHLRPLYTGFEIFWRKHHIWCTSFLYIYILFFISLDLSFLNSIGSLTPVLHGAKPPKRASTSFTSLRYKEPWPQTGLPKKTCSKWPLSLGFLVWQGKASKSGGLVFCMKKKSY